ncbi:MAG TPA: triphosphoribosyl-dephospho-CoA synthase [Candidatus Desulfobacillus sp.]|nr:triphosphoribosyl-dephospho-CoA synthase [Candidatus Desulfobacillus sp.]
MAEAARIRAAFLAACALDVAALKPGNVHRYADGHGMRAADFIASAEAAAPALCRGGAALGRRLLDAVTATRAAAGCNTNLGILLACAPLAMAAEAPATTPFARGVAAALRGLDAEDAELVYRAIALADPGGLGEAGEHDVRRPPRIGLVAAMRIAAPRDRIARLYAEDFADLFDTALPLLRARLAGGDGMEAATTMLYLALLARWPDSHLVRKFGDSAAQSVTREAADLLARLDDAGAAPARHGLLLDWDKSLKERGFNPGTSADLTVATLFAHGLTRDEARLA